MIVIMNEVCDSASVDRVSAILEEYGFSPHVVRGEGQVVVCAVGSGDRDVVKTALDGASDVQDVIFVSKPYKLASSSSKNKTMFSLMGKVSIGDPRYFVVIAGPCSVETEDQILSSADFVKSVGASVLRGGAYKPRTSPYSFQGLEEEGLKLLAKARERYGLPVVTELLSSATISLVDKYVDMIQIGARNMQNFALLKDVSNLRKPVFLKRGISATLEEFLMSAEYLMAGGNYNVVLCERGIRTFETAYRNTLDLNAVPALKSMTHLPIFVDPSHGTGRIDLIVPMSKAAIAAGADGLMLEVHPDPKKALSDGAQSLTFSQFEILMDELKPFLKAVGRELVIL